MLHRAIITPPHPRLQYALIYNLFSQVRCLKSEFQERQFPETAAELLEREATFRNYNFCLDQTVDNYNFLKTSTKSVEFERLARELE